MRGDVVIETARLRLRRWRPADIAPFAAMNADATVMQHFSGTLDRRQSEAMMQRICVHHERHGFGLWVLEITDALPFAGFVGLSVPSFQAHFMPAVEIGWRLSPDCWGKGYVTEAGAAALRHGFEALRLEEIVSFTVPANVRSLRVMERLGMHRDPADDFDHPNLPEGHHIRRHVLYRLTRQDWCVPQRA